MAEISVQSQNEQSLKPTVWDKIDAWWLNFQTVPLSQKVFFAENLRVMVKAGLSLNEALATLSLQTTSKKFKKVLESVKTDVEKGNSFAESLGRFQKVFSEFFISMVKMGEASGNLETALLEVALQMKKEHELISKIKSAMTYPILILAATAGIGAAMMVYVIPSVLSIFKEIKVDLPLSTKILIAASDAILNYGFFILCAVIILIAFFIFLIRTPKGKYYFHKFLLKFPILGPIIQKINLARFSRTLSSLLKTDIPIVQGCNVTCAVLGNVLYKKAMIEAADKLGKGASIASTLETYPKLFPPIVLQMVTVGERSGTTDELLAELAVFYEGQVDEITRSLTSIIEPILILFLGGAVALIAFAVISPIYTLSQEM